MSLPSDEQLLDALRLLSQALERYLPEQAPKAGDVPWGAISLYVAMQQVMLLAMEGSKLSIRAYQQQARQLIQSLHTVLTTEESQRLAALLQAE